MAQPSASELRRSFLKVFVVPALTLLLVPLLSWGFARYGSGRIDGMILESIGRQIDGDAAMSPEQRVEAKAFFAAHPASAACGDADPELQRYRESVCRRWGEAWQFAMAQRLAAGATALGVLALVGIGLLGLVAFTSRRAQYWSFMVGWRGLQAVSALEALAQGVLLVFLSYWVTGLLFESYYPKLIILAAIAAGLAVLLIFFALFQKPPAPDPLEAERVAEGDAPGLWARVRELAGRLGTAPPETLVAGIDDNFFVTEQPPPLADGTALRGRLLYVSLPLLRTLAPSEADAVLGHELAHFHGGDTAASARLYPAIARYHAYAGTLAEGGLTAPAAYLMRLYWAVFQLGLKREQRRRELRADAAAVRLTSPDDLGRSLLKIAGYSSFRAETEEELFRQRSVHEGALAIAARVDQGLAAHAASAAFHERLQTLEIPHPFDSHPPLEDRLGAAGATVTLGDVAGLLQAPPARTWVDEIGTAVAIEDRLWAAYEARFKEGHELKLAWSYLPATEEERQVVLRHFPELTFPAKDGPLTLNYRALTRANGERIDLADVRSAEIESHVLGKVLVLTRRNPAGKDRKFQVTLRHLGDQVEPFKAAFARYWKRAESAQERAPGQVMV